MPERLRADGNHDTARRETLIVTQNTMYPACQQGADACWYAAPTYRVASAEEIGVTTADRIRCTGGMEAARHNTAPAKHSVSAK